MGCARLYPPRARDAAGESTPGTMDLSNITIVRRPRADLRTCYRCDGSGIYLSFGTCFLCRGSGYILTNAAKAAENARKAASVAAFNALPVCDSCGAHSATVGPYQDAYYCHRCVMDMTRC